MLVDITQRWRGRSAVYRRAGETIDTQRYEVAALSDDATPKRFVLEHHYSGSYPAARYRFGLYRGDALVGVAVFGVPAHAKVLTNCLPGAAADSVELCRFVLLDDVPGNGESWMLGQAFAMLRKEGLVGVVSHSDPVARHLAGGRCVFPGHVGTIYQAHNGVYLGRTPVRTLRLFADGQVLSARAISKLRSGERGWRYVAKLLEAHGAPPLLSGEDRRSWAKRWVAALTCTLRHHGNHKYVWALHKRWRRYLPEGMAYPKLDSARMAA